MQNNTKDSLDDSLTSLQWLWNLNVNIQPQIDSCKPIDSVGQDGIMEEFSQIHPTLNTCKKRFMSKCHHQDLTNFTSVPPKTHIDPCLCNGPEFNSSTSNDYSLYKNNQFLGKTKHAKNIPTSNTTEVGGCSLSNNHTLSDQQKVVCDTNNQQNIYNGPLLSDAATSPTRNLKKELLADAIDYKTNAYVRPPFTFVSLICMALHKSKRNRMTSSSICKWIKDNYIYYRYADALWQVCYNRFLNINNYCIKT